MSDTLISPQLLKARGITYSRAHLWRLERDGRFPRRVRLGAGKFAYVEREIDDFIAARIAARDAEHATPVSPEEAAA